MQLAARGAEPDSELSPANRPSRDSEQSREIELGRDSELKAVIARLTARTYFAADARHI